MINYIWTFLIIVSIIFSFCFNTVEQLNNGIVTNLKSIMELVLTMTTSMCLWQGLLNVAEKSGIIDTLSKYIQPLVKKFFMTKNERCLKYISINMIANILGLGACATPAGLMTMKELNKENKCFEKGLPSHDMCMFLLINISSLQLFSMNLIMHRSLYNSKDPMSVIVPGIIATSVTTLFAIIYAFSMRRGDD